MLLPMHISQEESGKGGMIGPNCAAWMTSSIGMLLKYAHEVDKALNSWALILRNDRSLVVNFLYLDRKCNPSCNRSFCNIVILLDRNEQSSPVLSNAILSR